jgi:cold shock CspA family protein
MRGTVVKVVTERGYAFARDEEGRDRFLHAQSFTSQDAFSGLALGDTVQFDPIGEGDRSLRGVNVRVVSEQTATRCVNHPGVRLRDGECPLCEREAAAS